MSGSKLAAVWHLLEPLIGSRPAFDGEIKAGSDGGQLANAIYQNDIVPGGFTIPGDWPTFAEDRLPETPTPW